MKILGALDNFVSYLTEDPVRPSIPIEKRFGQNRYIFIEEGKEKPAAILCCSIEPTVPTKETELFTEGDPLVAIFYSIWSYEKGTARELLFEAVDYIRKNLGIDRYVTLSPKTEMAYNFHTKNGAVILQINEESVNYEYNNTISHETRI
jgi:DNA-binding XRE family transcriptional regulator